METLDVTSKAVIWDSLVLMPKPGNDLHCNSIVSAVYSLKSNWRIKTNYVTKTDSIWLLLFFCLKPPVGLNVSVIEMHLNSASIYTLSYYASK